MKFLARALNASEIDPNIEGWSITDPSTNDYIGAVRAVDVGGGNYEEYYLVENTYAFPFDVAVLFEPIGGISNNVELQDWVDSNVSGKTTEYRLDASITSPW